MAKENDTSWTFLSNHSHVLIALSRDPNQSLRDVSLAVGITERSVQRIVSELEEGGYLERERVGRGNHYKIKSGQPLRHSLEEHCAVDDLLHLIVPGRSDVKEKP